MNYNEMALKMHEEHKGKISVTSKVAVKTRDDLSTAYTPGVAEPCRKIRDNKDEVYRYTAKGNLVAVVSDGTAVLDWEISVRKRQCRLWKENPFCSKNLQELMHFQSAWIQKIPMRS